MAGGNTPSPCPSLPMAGGNTPSPCPSLQMASEKPSKPQVQESVSDMPEEIAYANPPSEIEEEQILVKQAPTETNSNEVQKASTQTSSAIRLVPAAVASLAMTVAYWFI
jgi:hypothetical protein